jgi:addiction module HigA family antidote
MALIAIHPGEHLAEELRALDMSAAELARQPHVPTNRVTQILNGRRAITGDTALRLAHFFGTAAEFWLNLRSLYELRMAKKRPARPSRTCRPLSASSTCRGGVSARLSLGFSVRRSLVSDGTPIHHLRESLAPTFLFRFDQ